MKKLTQEQVEQNVLNICKEKDYTLVEPILYNNCKTKLHLRCNKDGYEWTPIYSNFMINSGCQKCNGNSKITQQEAEEKVLSRCKEMNYTLVEPFIYIGNVQTEFYLKCDKDDHIWKSTYHSFITQKTGCKKCSKKYRPTQDEVYDFVLTKCKKLNYTLTKPFIYKNSHTEIYLKCNNDGYEWCVLYIEFINYDRNCRICSGKSKYSQEEIENKILERCEFMEYELIESFVYKNNKSKFLLKCKNGHEWHTSYTNFINGKRNCPICKSSKGEIIISKLLLKNDIKYNEQHKFDDCKNINHLIFDFFLPNHNICIEFDGIQHYKPIKHFGGIESFNKRKERDEIKTKYCKENNINLIRISYKKYNKIFNILSENLKLNFEIDKTLLD